MSNLVRLFRILEQVPADELRLEAGQPPYIVHQGKRRIVGSQALEPVHVVATATEVVSREELCELPEARSRVVRQVYEGNAYVVEIARRGSFIALAVKPVRQALLRASGDYAAGEHASTEEAFEHGSVMREVPQSKAYRPSVPPPSVRRRTIETMRALSVPPPPKVSPSREPAPPVRFESAELPAPTLRLAAVPPPPPSPEPTAVHAAASGARRIDELLRALVGEGGSDLHLSTGSPPAMRVDGALRFLEGPRLDSSRIEALVREIMPPRAIAEFEERSDADFAYEIGAVARFRVNVFRDRRGAGAVIRFIPAEVLTAEQLGLPRACLDLCRLAKGLVLVTGPTGSGKSTTLAAMIDHVNRHRSDHIITIEDPVEFVHENQRCLVNQREVGVHTKTFGSALRAALREDPDVVLVGEMRDLETIAVAIETAATGHLVFGTLHTTSAVSTVDRLIDQFPSERQAQIRVMLSESLEGVVAQTLCRRVGGGRVAAHEILLGTPAISALIRDGKTFQMPSIMQTSRGAGMATLNDSLLSLARSGLVEPREAWSKAVDKPGLLAMLKSAGLPTSFE